jgi:hypothetical protein
LWGKPLLDKLTIYQVTKKVPRFTNPECLWSCSKNLLFAPLLSHINLVQALLSYFLMVHTYIILAYRCISTTRPRSLRFLYLSPACISHRSLFSAIYFPTDSKMFKEYYLNTNREGRKICLSFEKNLFHCFFAYYKSPMKYPRSKTDLCKEKAVRES